ncbi:MAG: hypothetical protein AAFQ63_03510 [Cyanobacteria bacterium J06621_11]
MLINPWIVLAEIFNFLILVVVLQRFLYKPIMRAMAQREQSIADRLQSADVRETEAQTQIDQYQQLQANWAKQTQTRRSQMQQQLATERDSQADEIRLALEKKRVQWEEALRQEQKASLVDLRDRARSQLIQTVRSALRTLANTTLERQMVESFLTRIKTLSPAEKTSLQAAVAQLKNNPQWTIRTTFPLGEPLQQRLLEEIKEQLPNQATAESFVFESYPDYPCGIELRIEGYKLAWHLEHYLDSLESRLAYDLEQVPVL